VYSLKVMLGNHSPNDPPPVSYSFPTEVAARAALDRFRARFHTRTGTEPERRITYYDTFDWRVYRRGGALAVFADRGEWDVTWESRDGGIRDRLQSAQPPAFAPDFPEGRFRDSVAPILGVRRLLPLVGIEGRGEVTSVLAANERTLVRIRLELASAFSFQGADRHVPVPPRITILPVKGYALAHEVTRRFADEELGLSREPAGLLSLALTALGLDPGRMSSRLGVTLHPRMRADHAAKEILKALLDGLVANEEGTRGNLDTEFLHDFRVAVRRTRSCLSQLPDLFPEDTIEKFRNDFSWLGDVTGPTRDLDVYLLRMPDYRETLPPDVRPDLEPLAGFLAKRQAQAQARLASELDSDRYRALLVEWREFLESRIPMGPAPANAGRPILELASERIALAHERVVKEGQRVRRRGPAEMLHRVRIDCKKLRYLLEFFASLYDRRDLDILVKELKGLQDTLGEFNDLDVQQSALTGFAREMRAEQEIPVETLLAMGRLVEHLGYRQLDERKRFKKRFGRFASPENQARFARMLATPAPDLPAPARERMADADLVPGPPMARDLTE